MKRYAIIIGENNHKISRKVQKALFDVGIVWQNGDSVVKYVNKEILTIKDGDIGFWGSCNACDLKGDLATNDREYLWPSYVIEHAAELDGARKLWEIAPEGYRLVTEEERKALRPDSINGYKFFMKNRSDPWGYNSGSPCSWDSNGIAYAVPVDFTFAPPEKEIEVGGKMYSDSTLKNALREYVG